MKNTHKGANVPQMSRPASGRPNSLGHAVPCKPRGLWPRLAWVGVVERYSCTALGTGLGVPASYFPRVLAILSSTLTPSWKEAPRRVTRRECGHSPLWPWCPGLQRAGGGHSGAPQGRLWRGGKRHRMASNTCLVVTVFLRLSCFLAREHRAASSRRNLASFSCSGCGPGHLLPTALLSHT